jgi:hypothetical protein
MNSEWTIIYHLLKDPAKVDYVLATGFTDVHLKQERTRILFRLISDAWTKYHAQPHLDLLDDAKWMADDDPSLFESLDVAMRVCTESIGSPKRTTLGFDAAQKAVLAHRYKIDPRAKAKQLADHKERERLKKRLRDLAMKAANMCARLTSDPSLDVEAVGLQYGIDPQTCKPFSEDEYIKRLRKAEAEASSQLARQFIDDVSSGTSEDARAFLHAYERADVGMMSLLRKKRDARSVDAFENQVRNLLNRQGD